MRARGFAATLVVALALIGEQRPAVAQRSAPPPSPVRGGRTLSQTLVDRAAARGRIRVIVGLEVAARPEGLLTAADRVRQRSRIADAQSELLGDLAGYDLGRVKRFRVIPGMAMEVDSPRLQLLATHPRVAYVEEDKADSPVLAQSSPLIGATTAWAHGYTGTGWTVAVLDTGVERTHTFFGGRVVSEACYSSNTAESASVCPGGVETATGTGTAAPCQLGSCEHGTHVAGIAAGDGGSGSDSGVARGANIIAIQVYSDFASEPLSWVSDQILGLERVYALRGAYNIAAVNMSLGGEDPYLDQASCDADNVSRKDIIDTLRSVGIATVISSGNSGFVDAIFAPACISSAISVGSTTDGGPGASPADEVSLFTNSASFLNLLAPGESITSSVTGNGFDSFSGTSMAAPQVTGAWAVLKSRNGSATVSQILAALTNTGVGVLDPGNGLTKPRIAVDAAIDALPVPCSSSLSPLSFYAGSAGAARTIAVATQPGCAWGAVSNSSFITITGGSGNPGNGTVNYTVEANPDITSRTGTMTIAGITFTVVQTGSATPVPPIDMNLDANVDLLWHHQGDGRIAVWTMNGITLIDGTLLSPSQVPDTNWTLAGAGDLDRDGHADLVWHNLADRRVSAWLMNGIAAREGSLLSVPEAPGPDWRIRAVTDLNGDEAADIVWQNQATGLIAAWLMNGFTVVEGRWFDPYIVGDVAWKIVGTGDFNGDGSVDLVWHHQGDGRIAVWFMDGMREVSGSLTIPGQVADLAWKIRAVGDLNRDGHPDLVWQNVADGRVSAWLMNGLNLIDGSLLNPPVVSDTGWQIVGPR